MKAKFRLYSKALRLALLFLLGFLIAGGLFPAIELLLPPVRAKHFRDSIKIRWLNVFSRILKLEVEKKGNVASRPAFIVSNHISWLDIIVLGQFVPGCFAAKSDIAGWPVIGYLSRQAGTVFIRRGDKRQIVQTTETMAWQLRQNGNILVFPEGTTTAGDQVMDFHASLFQPALLTKAAIQPAAIRYLGAAKETAPFIGDDEFVAHLLKMLAMERIEVNVDFLPPIDSEGKTRNWVSSEARGLIETTLASDDFADKLPYLRQKITQAK
ncbi:lysophospholipid acyltransferase family protein [Methylomicrobium sp. Wu6]|uniref:lysophospholipid acyltransferase family protein n=1 Tax=Methylomicrobium sp. Wu6 TaxID=3107928 RepID=UPI002DD69C5B|nr:lysophospholipid acyltransferase family protein [Methylomicrobium sp. Wu6]MEC4749069.1 lysophospholipid acyltransferase family protein [Methylomicrobium sp. Wu6]